MIFQLGELNILYIVDLKIYVSGIRNRLMLGRSFKPHFFPLIFSNFTFINLVHII
jgi:hypothetical protein